MVRLYFLNAFVVLALLKNVAQSINIYVTNECSTSIVLAHVTLGGLTTDQLDAGRSLTKSIAIGSGSHVFKSGTGPQATLAEFSAEGGKCWLDISTIPTSATIGPGNCMSLQDCKDLTGGVGFNVPMQIRPHTQDNDRCVALTCMYDGCDCAYQYPADNTKTHTCSLSTDYDLKFCPGSSDSTHTPVTQAALIDPSKVSPMSMPTSTPPSTPSLTPTSSSTETAWLPSTQPTKPLSTEQSSLLPTSLSGSTSPDHGYTILSTNPVDLGSKSETDNKTFGNVNTSLHSITTQQPANNAHNTTQQTTYTTEDTMQQMTYTTEDGVQQTEYTTDDAAQQNGGPTSTNEDVQQINNRSGESNGTSKPYFVLAIGGCMGMVAAVAIVVVRKKKLQLEELESKTPLSAMADGTLSSFHTPRDNVNLL